MLISEMSKNAVDKIGATRKHRWIGVSEQVARLEPRCRAVMALDNVDRDDLVALARPGTVVELAHAFLLADPRARRRPGGMQADLRRAIDELAERGAVVADLDSGLTTSKDGHRKALLALADAQISRSNRGLRSALNGAKSRGRPRKVFTPEELEQGRKAWESRRLKYWRDVKAKLPKGMTLRRAWQEFGPRNVETTNET